MTVLVSPEFDPLTKTWFLTKPVEVEAPTLRALLYKLPGGHYLDATYNLHGDPIPINKIPERDGEAPQRAPFQICNHKKPAIEAASPRADEGFTPRSVVAKRATPRDGRMPERFRNSHAEVMKLASHRIEAVAVLYAQGVPFRQIGKKIGVKENTISMIVHRQRKRGDLRFKPRPGDERYHSRKSNAAAEKGAE